MSPARGDALDPTSLRVTHVNRYEGDFGPRTFINFRSDVDYTRYLWRASREVRVEPGQQVVVSGVIKDTDESGQIELTRCRLEGEQGETAARGSFRKVDTDSPAGRVILAVDSGGSWVSSVLMLAASLLTLVPLLGLLIALFLVPVLLILVTVLTVRLARRRGRDVAGTHIVRRNLIVSCVCLAISLFGGAYQIAVAASQILLGTGS